MNGNLAYQDAPREEIIGGHVVMMAPASLNHGRVVRNVGKLLDSYLENRTCEYFPDGVGLRLSDQERYEPDGMVVCDPEKVHWDGIHGAPDLVVEVLSRSTAWKDRGHKKDTYERFGVREYWIVDPIRLSVEQYVLEDGRFSLRGVFHKYPVYELDTMSEQERKAIAAEFQCSIFADLTVRLDVVFGRIVTAW